MKVNLRIFRRVCIVCFDTRIYEEGLLDEKDVRGRVV